MWTVKPADYVSAEQKATADRAKELAGYKVAFDAHLDAVAQARGYDNRITIGTYLGSSNARWAAEAEAFIQWRDFALAYLFAQLAAVEAGEIPAPTIPEFIAGVPAMIWP